MKNLSFIFGLSLLLGMTAMPVPAQVVNDDNEDGVVKINANQSKYDYVQGQVLVKFKDDNRVRVNASRGQFRSCSVSSLTKVLQKYGTEEMEQLLPNENPNRQLSRSQSFTGETIEERDLSQLYRVILSDNHVQETMQLIDELNTLDEVEFAEPNYLLHTLENVTIDGITGNNPFDASQWYLLDYGVASLWLMPIINRTRPIIAIIDTGVDITHPDLVDNLWTNEGEVQGENGYDNDGNGFKNDLHGWDFINNTANVRDYNAHGTHVAGIAAASNNNIGIIGANPRALIMPVTVMQSDGSGDVATIVKGISYAVQNGANVLNLSLGTYANSRALRQALENAYSSAVIVAAAGNDGKCINSLHHPIPCYDAAPMFPAAYSFVLGVQATDRNGNLAGFSNYDDDGQFLSAVATLQDPDGFNYELKAPGTSIYSTIPGGKYKALQGTSMAAPLVAGAISFLKMVKNYDTQEILWGDLLHSNNIYQAYQMTQRPAELDLVKVLFRDHEAATDEIEDDYSNDGEVDAGETVYLYPVIRTTFGGASNIRMYLEMGDEFDDASIVEILTDMNHPVDFGIHLDTYGKAVSLNPLKVRVADNVADNRHIKMKLVATCDETSTVYEGHFSMVVVNMVKINGLISEDRTLTADHVYLVNENIGVMEGATLTIEPGTRLEFAEGMGLSSYGKLVAKGTPEKPIVFTGYHGAKWAGIKSHSSKGEHRSAEIFTNSDQTLFTLLPTEATQFAFGSKRLLWYGAEYPNYSFNLTDYLEGFTEDMTAKQHLFTDPNYLTPAVLQMLSDYEAYCSQLSASKTEEKPFSGYVELKIPSWSFYDIPRDTISYCRIDGYNGEPRIYYPYMIDCTVTPSNSSASYFFYDLDGLRNTISDVSGNCWSYVLSAKLEKSNIVNNYFTTYADVLPRYSYLNNNNYFNNFARSHKSGKYYMKNYSLAINSSSPIIDNSTTPSYLGTSREDIIRPYIYEIGNAPDTYGSIDLSNLLTIPVAEAHGIVWKVLVNGKDAQDEYEDLAPLGVGKQKFEVYFNRPMNKEVAPLISFGVRDPYTQNAVAEEGSWNGEGTIYTAYKTITGKTKSDGVNRIYVRGAEDDEYFEIPYEKTRFNVMINAAGSMATGFAAEAKMGRVELTWNNEDNDFEDAMGFNVYRYQLDDEGYEVNNVRLNQEIVDIETTEYTDYDVTPGETYYYSYKVLSTDLQEYDVSNVVAATPMTSELGDANGDTEVDVLDVMTTVNYAAGMNPKPFIFEAADMNTDLTIDILDVIGIIRKILYPDAGARLAVMAEAVYTIEDGVLYVESPVALAGVQVQVSLPQPLQDGSLVAYEDLKGFEQVSARMSDNDLLFLAYSMSGRTLSPGKHALLYVGDAKIASIRLSDSFGHGVKAAGSDATVITRLGSEVMTAKGVYDLQGRKLTGGNIQDVKLPKGVYIINGKKVVK